MNTLPDIFGCVCYGITTTKMTIVMPMAMAAAAAAGVALVSVSQRTPITFFKPIFSWIVCLSFQQTNFITGENTEQVQGGARQVDKWRSDEKEQTKVEKRNDEKAFVRIKEPILETCSFVS